MFNLVSVDGFFAGTDGNIDWHVVDPEFDRWAAETIDEYDTALLGRVTYDLFAGYWPNALSDPAISGEDRVVAQALDTMTKIVFSKSLRQAEWNNTRIYREIDPEEIKELKEASGKNMVIYGSGTIVRQLANLGLIDEYRLMVNPVSLGTGKPLFKDVKRMNLKLNDAKSFKSGNVLLTYRMADSTAS